jgi:HEAT repeat protein
MDIRPTSQPTPPTKPALPIVLAAKWPPDDADLPGGAGPAFPSGPGGFGPGDDGNFKRGAFKPIAIIVVIAIVIGGAVAAFMAFKTEGERKPKEQTAKEMKDLQLLPWAEQLPKWRALAKQTDDTRAQQEAFEQLAWKKDPEGLQAIIAGLASPEHIVVGRASQAILEYGSPMADGAKPALIAALAKSTNADKPQICLALIALHEPSVFDQVLAEYKLGHLSTVTRLDGFKAFDAEEMAKMVSLDKIASLAGDENESVRQLVATVLSRTGDAKWTDVLTKLVQDKVTEVAREAAVGLGKIANEASMKPLLTALSTASKDNRAKFLEALRDGVGGKGLVFALQTVSHEKPETEKFQMKQLFDMMKELEDPRIGDALLQWVQQTAPKPHWKTEAGMRMAEVGDVRAAPILGWRLSQDPLKLYNDVDWPELRRDDNERVYAARMLADLAIAHPEAKGELLKAAEDSTISWCKDKPQPHSNGLRFLVNAGSKDIIPALKAWADPKDKLPGVGEVGNFPMGWVTAQSALRYLGQSQNGWDILDKQLNRRPPKIDASWDALLNGGLTILGMALRGLGYGASDGFALWGDPKAAPILIKHIESPLENEQSRDAACFALSWVATDDVMKQVAEKVKNNDKDEPKAVFLRKCYLETLTRKPVQEANATLIDMLKPNVDIEIRHRAARAIGIGGMPKALMPILYEKLKDKALRTDAALALLLGGDEEWAMRAIAYYNTDSDPAVMEELKDAYNGTFYYWSDKNYDNGDVARWVENAQAIAHIKVRDTMQDWVGAVLARNLIESIEFDSGPHSITRVVLRAKLLADAKGPNEVKRNAAINVLKFLKEKGVLMALRYEQGPVGEIARKAFFEVMNPKAVIEKIPDSPKAENKDSVPSPGARALPPR